MHEKMNAIFILVMVCIAFCSCRHQERYPFLNEENQISAISIVWISFDGSGNVVETVLLKMNRNYFCRIKKVNC